MLSFAQFFSLITLYVAFIGIFDSTETSFSQFIDIAIFSFVTIFTGFLMIIFGLMAYNENKRSNRLLEDFNQLKKAYFRADD